MTSIIPVGGRADAAGDGGLQILAPGISLPFADGRYVRRYVGAVLTADTALGANSSGPEAQFRVPSPASAIFSIPSDASPSLFESEDGARIGIRFKAFRAGNVAEVGVVRFNGTFQSPTAVLAGQVVGAMRGRGFAQVGNNPGIISEIHFQARENISTTTRGGAVNVRAVEIGTVDARTCFSFDVDSSTVGNLKGVLSTTRLIPAAVLQGRNPLNTASVWESGADDYALFGGARVTRRAAIANPAADVASLQTAVIAILDALRPTTGINLIAP